MSFGNLVVVGGGGMGENVKFLRQKRTVKLESSQQLPPLTKQNEQTKAHLSA